MQVLPQSHMLALLLLTKKKLSVLTFDFRGSGNSSGEYVTLG
jgi:alpha/beta superfamily hydrolase